MWWASLCLLAGLGLAAAAPAAPNAADLKAAALLNCIRFISWPPTAFASANAPIVIGIIGTDPYGQQLDHLLADEVIHNRSLIVKRLGARDEVRDCQLLFVGDSERSHLSGLLQQVAGHPVLTVSALPGFAPQGGMINLIQTGAETKLEINHAVAEKANLQISGKLLSLATIVPSP